MYQRLYFRYNVNPALLTQIHHLHWTCSLRGRGRALLGAVLVAKPSAARAGAGGCPGRCGQRATVRCVWKGTPLFDYKRYLCKSSLFICNHINSCLRVPGGASALASVWQGAASKAALAWLPLPPLQALAQRSLQLLVLQPLGHELWVSSGSLPEREEAFCSLLKVRNRGNRWILMSREDLMSSGLGEV